jgi:hypothetical protein
MHRAGIAAVIALIAGGSGEALTQAEDQAAVVESSRALVSAPPWPDGD